MTLRARRDGAHSVLEVADSGHGIPAERVDRIFDRFYRIEGGVASGSGLGLAIARELAGRMGGTLEFSRNPPRRCSRFVWRLLQCPRAPRNCSQAEPLRVFT